MDCSATASSNSRFKRVKCAALDLHPSLAMAFIHQSSPHTHSGNSVWLLMRWVLLALVPGIAVLTYFYGPGVLVNGLLLSIFCLLTEALCLKARQMPLAQSLKDGSALVTAWLLAVSLPPYCPAWLLLLASVFSIGLTKHLYGGLGFNPFNPAMVAYVVLLVSFPVEMTRWPVPQGLLAADQALPTVLQTLQSSVGHFDAVTGATALDQLQHKQGRTLADLQVQSPLFSQASWAAYGSEWVNLAFLLGGLLLLYKRIFSWHAPLACLASLSLMALLFYDNGSSHSPGSLALHWSAGATCLGAFFILTDPVSSAVSPRGKVIFGALAGVLIYAIRAWGQYPDGVAFAVLLVNFAAPVIDYYTLPRTYGHDKRQSANRFRP
jgi:Na+-translocating ferredoxin:NAD+ oxidoreductase subunit D